MVKIRQEITRKDILTPGRSFPLAGTWDEHDISGSGYISFGIQSEENFKIKEDDVLELIVKTPVVKTLPNKLSAIPIYFVYTKQGILLSTDELFIFPPSPIDEAETARWNNLVLKLSQASESNPVIIYLKLSASQGVTGSKGDWFIADGLYVDFKKVKAIHADGKNFKEFAIDGHIYNFRRANLPADEQTELQVLIDGYDWTHLSATAKSLAANSLTWDQISGEPAIHAGVTVTGITHPAIDADGTLVATISFSRLLSDGTTDLATKQVNIAFVAIKAAPLSIWYSDSAGNVYLNGVKKYSHLEKVSGITCDKDGNVFYLVLGKGVYKNGSLLYANTFNDLSTYQGNIAVSTNGDVIYSTNTKIYKNGVELNYHFWNGLTEENQGFRLDKDGNIYYPYNNDIYKNGASILSIYHEQSFNSILIDKDGNWFADSYDGKYVKNGVKVNDNHVWNNYSGAKWLFSDKDAKYGYFIDVNSYGLHQYEVQTGNNVKTIQDYSTSRAITAAGIDSKTNDIYILQSDKKILKMTWDGTKHSNPVVLYTTEQSVAAGCGIAINTNINGRTGYFGEPKTPGILLHTDYTDYVFDDSVGTLVINGGNIEFSDVNQSIKDSATAKLKSPLEIEFKTAFTLSKVSWQDFISINIRLTGDDSTGSSVFGFVFTMPSKSINILAGHKYRFEEGKDPVDLGAY